MTEEKRIYTIATAHLDTIWNWDFEYVIDTCLPKTLDDNFRLFETYPNYRFNFEGAYRYELFEEYYPEKFEKLKEYNCEMIFHEIYDDDHEAITKGCLQAIEQGAELVLCTGGMSVDPDDRTPLAIKNTGARMVSYGAPVLPGAMFLLSYYQEKIPIVGLPGCVMYAKRTIFDLALPRLLADDEITAEELAALGEGGLCLNCPVCTYPNCGFGKGW